MFGFESIIERRIQEAMERGEFDDLAGKGKPLVFEDDTFVPEDLRMAYRVLKNAGYLPPEVLAEKEIQKAEDLLDATEDEKERYKQMQKLNLMITRLNVLRKRSVSMEKEQAYYDKVAAKITLHSVAKQAVSGDEKEK